MHRKKFAYENLVHQPVQRRNEINWCRPWPPLCETTVTNPGKRPSYRRGNNCDDYCNCYNAS